MLELVTLKYSIYDESNQTINVSKMIKNMKAELYECNYTFTVE